MRNSSATTFLGSFVLGMGAITLVSTRRAQAARPIETAPLPESGSAAPHTPQRAAVGTKPAGMSRRIVNALGLVLAVAAVVFWALFLRPQSLGGPAAYVLVSGHSMLPLYHTGDLVLVEHKSSYHVGEVIAYHVPKGDPMAGAQVIHRIVGGNAKTGFLVQGDNRTAPDVWRPTPKDIVGAKALRIPDGAVYLHFLRSPLLLGLFAACFVFLTVLSRGGEKTKEHAAVGPDALAHDLA